MTTFYGGVYLLTLDSKDVRSVGIVAEGYSQRRASLRVPLRSEQLAMGSSVLLHRLKRPARSSNRTNTHRVTGLNGLDVLFGCSCYVAFFMKILGVFFQIP